MGGPWRCRAPEKYSVMGENLPAHDRVFVAIVRAFTANEKILLDTLE